MSTRTSTKEKLLQLLKKEQQSTVALLAKHMGITEMAVRKHLNVLDRDGLLQVQEMKQPMGRPIAVFSLSAKGKAQFPNNYETLTTELLNDLEALHGQDTIHYLLQQRSARQKDSYSRELASLSFAERVEKLASLQDARGYMTELREEDEHTYELIEYNCPIFAVANQYKKACHCETEMFQHVLDTPHVTRTTCRADNGDHCRFRITAPAHKEHDQHGS
ncbi:DeoR family transcriptional regulator [Fictibacillus macauensis ZFHKF-1]|uniref:DeoR family transcriptional regulator n=1 Tax=Fictibacillus macauensis ZFHKF-1 TaxID=1196324 RepID=I8J320_9BACL|nr:DeoR family transcriptional regulator [Fictibacillus macauensis]EIT86151.1 DeoR family transcriptional regulator [Fictibacillus macauensis ZFHKF-1]